MGGVAAFVAKLVRAPLEVIVDRAKLSHDELVRDVTHNRSNADTKFQAMDARVTRNTDDIVALGKADVEHASAIRHLEETLRTGLDTIRDRLDDAATMQKQQYDQLSESLRDLRHNERRS